MNISIRYTGQILFIFIILIGSCIDPFDVSVPGGNNLLVVEGLITDDPGPYTVKLSRSSLLTQDTFPPVSGATVIIEEEGGESDVLREIEPGEYQSNGIRGTPGKRYRLLVDLADERSYATDWTLLKPSPEIVNVYSEFQDVLIDLEPKVGYQFFVDSQDPENNTTYYRYEWTEWWKYAVPFPSTSLYMGNDSVLPIPIGERSAQCWEFQVVRPINIATSRTASEDVVARHPLNFVTNDPERLKIRYGLRVTQFAVTEEEYRFWESLQQTSAESGSLFDQQPEIVRSNLQNINNPNERVFGYFSVSGVSRKSGYVEFLDITVGVADLYTQFCLGEFLSIPKGPDSEERIQELLAEGWLFYSLRYPPIGPQIVNGYTFISPFCGDCTFRGGSNTGPEWWIE